MNEQNKNIILGIVVVILIVGGVYYAKNGKKVYAPDNTWTSDVQVGELKDNINTEVEVSNEDTILNTTQIKPNTDNIASNLTKEQKDLLMKLQIAVNARDFESFALALLEVYKNQWSQVKELIKLESDMYVYATDEYWKKGDLANSLRVSTIVYNQVPEAWRFRYLRIITLEKYGRNAFNSGDLKTAENYANQILQMMFRPEGADLLADIYISKINTNIKDGNTTLAKQNFNFIRDYEISANRREILNELKKQLGL